MPDETYQEQPQDLPLDQGSTQESEPVVEAPPPRRRGRPRKGTGRKKTASELTDEIFPSPAYHVRGPSLVRPPQASPYRLYRMIALSFSGISLALLAVIFYFSSPEARLTVTAKRSPVSTNFSVSIQKISPTTPLAQAATPVLPGLIVSKSGELTKAFPTSLQKVSVEKAAGTVTIFNNFNKSQSLVVTTRLLSPGGVLFRIQKAVTIPALGKVEGVPVLADKKGPEGEIGPSKFTIPGLWSGLQDKIFAKSFESMKGGSQEMPALSPDDLKKAKQVVEDELSKQTMEALEKEFGKPSLTVTEIKSSGTDTKMGAGVATFNYTVKMAVVGIIFDQARLLDLAKKSFESSFVPDSYRQLAGVKESTLTYFLEDYDAKKNIAQIKVFLEGESMIAPSSPLLAKEKMAGLRKGAVENYLKKFEDFTNVSVRLYPFWARSLPKDASQILVELK